MFGVFFGGEGVGDGFAEEFGISLAEAMDGDFEGGLGHIDFGGGFGIRGSGGTGGEVGFEGVEEDGFTVGFVFVVEFLEDLVEEGERPLSFVDFVGGKIVAGFGELEAGFGVVVVEGENGFIAAALEAVGFFPFVRHEVFDGSEEESAEFAL